MEIKEYKELNEDVKYLRNEVFVKEQGFHNEFDDIDNHCTFLVCYQDGNPAGMVRYFSDDNVSYHIGRVCVLKSYRHQGIASLVMKQAIADIKELGGHDIILGAQVTAMPFYQQLGFTAFNETYYDEHCLHQDMKLVL